MQALEQDPEIRENLKKMQAEEAQRKQKGKN